MKPTRNNSVVTQESVHFTLRDLTAPILRRKRMTSLTFLFAFSVTLSLGRTLFQTRTLPSYISLLPAQSSAATIVIAIIMGLLASISLTYLVDYSDPCFYTPAQVIRTLRVPLVIAIPKRTP